MDRHGMEELRAAVVYRAMQDYLGALRVIHRYPDKKSGYISTARKTILECEEFFREDSWIFTEADGIYLMETIREKSWDKHFRIRRED